MSLPGAPTCLWPTLLTTRPLLAPRLLMGWRNAFICICMSWGDRYLYTDRWELLHNGLTNHQKINHYVIVSSPINKLPQHPILKRHHSIFPVMWETKFYVLAHKRAQLQLCIEHFFFLNLLLVNREINDSELSGRMRPLNLICISNFIERFGIVHVLIQSLSYLTSSDPIESHFYLLIIMLLFSLNFYLQRHFKFQISYPFSCLIRSKDYVQVRRHLLLLQHTFFFVTAWSY
jgi:hypothetical protein